MEIIGREGKYFRLFFRYEKSVLVCSLLGTLFLRALDISATGVVVDFSFNLVILIDSGIFWRLLSLWVPESSVFCHWYYVHLIQFQSLFF